MSESGDGVWRDEERLPLAELSRAVATSSTEGQQDDVTGNDAGLEQAFGDQQFVETAESGSGDPDPNSEAGRRLRPSPLGRQGPA